MLDLRARDDLTDLARLATDLRRASPEVEWMLVGAAARDIYLSAIDDQQPERRTLDIDFALRTSGWDEFGQLRQALSEAGFDADSHAWHRFTHPDGRDVDLVPFGAIANSDQQLAWPPDGSVLMNVRGFREALLASEVLCLPGNVELRMASLPGLLMLKLLAWIDRGRADTGKDAVDLRLLLDRYTDLCGGAAAFEPHPDLFDDDFDYVMAGARVAGRDVARLIASHGQAEDDLIGHLRRALEPEVSPDTAGRLLGASRAPDVDAVLRLFASFYRGMGE
ncbi:MAG: nucleotidyl transferase AbiEii/AbiGii toxin family protein [Lysobacteraceae bacterium]